MTFSQKKNGNRSTQPQIKKEHFWQYKFFFIINKQLETAAALSNKSQIIIQVSIYKNNIPTNTVYPIVFKNRWSNWDTGY